MEFTPNKKLKSVIHQNPCASTGKIYLSRFHRNRSRYNVKDQNATPPKLRVNNRSSNQKSSLSLPMKPKLLRANNILQNSQYQNSLKNVRTESKWNANSKYKSIQNENKNPRRALPYSLDTSDDPYNVFTDDEDADEDIFLSDRYEKPTKGNRDKENTSKFHFKSFKPAVKASTANPPTPKRKLSDLTKSNILFDISPQKVKLALNSENLPSVKNMQVLKNEFYFEEKENLERKREDAIPLKLNDQPHMTGFPNFGNTCYLNAVVQAIVSLHPFVIDLRKVVEGAAIPSNSVTQSLWNIIVAREKLDSSVLRTSLRNLKENVEKIDGSFSGFKMQDANEFLTQMLDMVKDEIKKYNCHSNESRILLEDMANLEKQSAVKENINGNSPGLKQCKSIFSSPSCSLPDQGSSIFDTPSSTSPLSLEIKVKENGEHIIDEDDVIFLNPKHRSFTSQNGIENDSLNPVISNFEFELLESFRCLGCGETEVRKQKHFALYVDLPNEEEEESIQKAVETYMGEDKRELTCEKCKHKNASFLTSFIQLPRVLIVQMKRYEYKPKQLECIKVSSKVAVNTWLHLDSLTSENFTPPPNFVTHSTSKELEYCKLSPRSPPSIPHYSNTSTVNGKTIVENGVTESDAEFTTSMKIDDSKDDKKDTSGVCEGNSEENAEKMENGVDKEEEEFQRAIKLSLQDMGTYFANNHVTDEVNTTEPKVLDSTGEAKKGKNSYHLLSVISHYGLTTCTGHYVSDVLNIEENQWYHYDDESVSSLSESAVLSEGLQKNGYIFFYIHQDMYTQLKDKKT